MSEIAAAPASLPARRRQGRPVSGGNDVGRERLLAAAEKLLREMPPARVTISRIAREAKADPALIRYYFGNRAALLVAVVDRVTAHPMRAQSTDVPIAALADHVRRTVQLVRDAPFLHRLINDELEQAGTEETRDRVRAMNLDLVDFYRRLLSTDGGCEMIEVNPLFLYITVLGASDFFSLAEPLIRQLVPPGTDMEQLTRGFQDFLAKLVLDGVRRR